MAKQDRAKQDRAKKAKHAAGGKKGGGKTQAKHQRTPARRSLESLPLHTDDDAALYHVVIETSKGSPNKLGYDEQLGAFTLHAVLPQGAVFPFDFGFLPRTKGEDGDPLDVLVLMQAPVAPGTVVPTRLVGVIEAEQREKSGDTVRNDRIIGVAPACVLYRDVHALDELPAAAVDEIEQFFVNYERQEGKEFRPLGRGGAREAAALVRRGMRDGDGTGER
jgi:inorganic pyrophosphatase